MRIKYVIERVCCNLLSQVNIKEEKSEKEKLDMCGFKDVIVGEVLKFKCKHTAALKYKYSGLFLIGQECEGRS